MFIMLFRFGVNTQNVALSKDLITLRFESYPVAIVISAGFGFGVSSKK